MLNKKDLGFLKNLQHEMLTQDNLCQANPRFWVLMDYKWVIAQEGCEERVSIFCFDLCEEGALDLEEVVDYLIDYIKENHSYEEDIVEALEGMKSSKDIDLYELENIMNEFCLSYSVHDESLESFIVPNTMFLTDREAKQHIKSNHYHYTNKVHTYAMTAWRSPQVSKLFEILENTDWESMEDIK